MVLLLREAGDDGFIFFFKPQEGSEVAFPLWMLEKQ